MDEKMNWSGCGRRRSMYNFMGYSGTVGRDSAVDIEVFIPLLPVCAFMASSRVNFNYRDINLKMLRKTAKFRGENSLVY
jgi:hypothetical protein